MSEALGKLADIHYGRSPAPVLAQDGAIPVYGTGGVYGKARMSLFPGPAIVVPRKGSLGNPSYVPTPFWPSDTTYAVVPRSGVDAKWLFYNLDRYDLTRLNEATGVPSISRDWLARIQFQRPDSNTQRRIAAILTTVDEVIEATEKLVEKHQQIKAGLMHDLFTRGLWTRPELARGDHKGLPCEATAQEGQLRPTPEEAPGLYQGSKVGLVPKEWAVKPLADYTQHDITYGIVQAGPHVEGGIPYIRTGDMSGEELVRDEMLCTSPLIAASYSRSQIRKGEIVCAIRATVGKVLPVPGDLDGANLTQGTARIAPNPQTHTGFLLWAIRCPRVQREITLTIKGTTFMEITLGDLRKLPVSAPKGFNEQAAIAAQLEGCESVIRETRTHLAKLRQQKQGLMHDLLTGRVRVDGLADS